MNGRLPLVLNCVDDVLAATLHPAQGTHGLLMLQGGGQTRAGPHGSFTRLADILQSAGFPVLRFDRRGIGDSSGQNKGWRHASEDILAAKRALQKAQPQLEKISALGMCDGAAALLCAAKSAEFSTLLLINLWLEARDDAKASLSPAFVKKRYWQKLGRINTWQRLLCGEIRLSALQKGWDVLRRGTQGLVADPHIAAAWADYRGARLVLLSEDDAIAQNCRLWLANSPSNDGELTSIMLAGADHSLSRADNIALAGRHLIRFLENH